MIKWRDIIVESYIFLCFYAIAYAETTSRTDSGLKCNNLNGCSTETDPDGCQQICGCDGIYKFDDSRGECVIDYEYLKERTRSNNLMQTENDVSDDDGLAKSIRERTERVFKGIIYSALFIVVCASACVVSVCVFCCHLHCSDEKLNNEVKALASKLQVDLKKKETIKKTLRDQKEESCNVIVEDANVICV